MAYGKTEEIIVVRKWKVEKYMEQIYVQTEDLSVGYHKKVLLSDIALKVNKGEILVLIGPNGAGKEARKQYNTYPEELYINSHTLGIAFT
jgi:iron complex transport system ATP-binding protein